MKMALRELLRRPQSFAVPASILVLLALLLLYPSAILDGLTESTTGALRTAPADLIVYSDDAKASLMRSRIDAPTRAQIEAVDGVAAVDAFDVVMLGSTVTDRAEPVGLAVLSSERAIGPEVPAPGEAYVDRTLQESAGIEEGDELVVGPFDESVRVVGFADDINLFFQAGMVVHPTTWRAMLGQTVDPAAEEAAGGEPAQTMFVTVADDADVYAVAAAIDEATAGATMTITPTEALRSLPGMAQQQTTFGAIRMVTLGVALVVVGLFLSFVTLERTPLYAVLKALGMSSRQLFTGVVVQVLMVTLTAALLAAALTWVLTQLPLELPTSMKTVRLAETLVALGATSVLGSVLSLRKVARVDPASAIG